MVQGSGFRVQGSGFRVQGLGFRVLSVAEVATSFTVGNALGLAFGGVLAERQAGGQTQRAQYPLI